MTDQRIQQDAICYQWFKQQLILSVSKLSISQRSQIKEDTVCLCLPEILFSEYALSWPAWLARRRRLELNCGLTVAWRPGRPCALQRSNLPHLVVLCVLKYFFFCICIVRLQLQFTVVCMFLILSSSAFCLFMLVWPRYLFALQIKRDLAAGTLVCQEHTAVLLASFVVQGIQYHIIIFNCEVVWIKPLKIFGYFCNINYNDILNLLDEVAVVCVR